jgi:hypothetical protein
MTTPRSYERRVKVCDDRVPQSTTVQVNVRESRGSTDPESTDGTGVDVVGGEGVSVRTNVVLENLLPGTRRRLLCNVDDSDTRDRRNGRPVTRRSGESITVKYNVELR